MLTSLPTADAVGYLLPLLRSYGRSPKPVCLTKLPGFTIPIFGYLPGVPTLSEKPESLPALNQVVVCDFGESSLGQAAFGRVDEPRLFEINF